MFCGTENIFCDITYFPHKCATFVVPFVFWFTKMLTLTIFTHNRWGVWPIFLCRFKGCYNVFCGTENIFCDITYFPHKCAIFVVPFVSWFTKMLTLTIFSQNRWWEWLKCVCRFKGCYNLSCGTENIFCDITYFPHKCATFVVPFVFWFTKMLTLTIFTQNRRGVWLKFLYRFKGYYNVFCGTGNIFCDITYFPHKCAIFVVPFVSWFTKMLTLTIFSQNRWWEWLKCVCRFKGCYNLSCGTENIFCDITYFPHKCATFVVPFVFWFTKMLTLTIFTQNRRGVWLKFLYRFKGYYNVFCGTGNIFCDITYFPHKCATFVVPFVSWFTKMLTLTIFSQNRWWEWLKCVCRFKGCYNLYCGTENIFCDITYFPHKCATFVVPFVFWFTKMLTLTIFTQNRWGVWLKFLYRFKGYYNVFCGTENIFCDITYFPHKWATFVVPFVFWFTKMLTLTIFTHNRWGVWLVFLCRFKVYYNVFCGTENIFCDITYLPHKCAIFVVPFVFWFTKMLTLTIFSQNRWWVWLQCVCRFKGYYNLFCGTENIFCDITYFPHKCATFVVPFVFWFTKMLTLTIFTQNRRGVWLKFLYRFKWLL